MRTSSTSWAWLWVLLAVLGGAGGAFYYYKARGFAPGAPATEIPADSAGGASDSLVRADTNAGLVPPRQRQRRVISSPSAGAAAPAVPRAAPADSAPPPVAPLGPASADVVGPVDSGGIRLMGLPRGSTVMIDEQPVSQALTKLPPGPHALAISAPKYNFYSDTIVVRPGQIQELTPQLTQIGAPVPSRREPAPRRRAASLVRATTRMAPASTSGPSRSTRRSSRFPPTPSPSPRPSLLWVKVSSEGRTVDIMRLRPSNDPAFEREVRNFVWTVTWHPALKDGAPVEAWTQMLFPPAQPQ